MERIDEKIALINDTLSVFNKIKNYGASTPKSVIRAIEKSISKDLKTGLKIIDKRVPVYIELPNYKKEGNGQYSMEYENTSPTETKEIITTPVVLSPLNQQKQHE